MLSIRPGWWLIWLLHSWQNNVASVSAASSRCDLWPRFYCDKRVCDQQESESIFLLTTGDVIRFHLFSHHTVPCVRETDRWGASLQSAFLHVLFFAVFFGSTSCFTLNQTETLIGFRRCRPLICIPVSIIPPDHRNLCTLWFTGSIAQWLLHGFI